MQVLALFIIPIYYHSNHKFRSGDSIQVVEPVAAVEFLVQPVGGEHDQMPLDTVENLLGRCLVVHLVHARSLSSPSSSSSPGVGGMVEWRMSSRRGILKISINFLLKMGLLVLPKPA